MKLSTLGIFLLLAMVAAKYIITQQSTDHSDRSFENGIVLDYRNTYLEIARLKTQHDNRLLALTSSNPTDITPVQTIQANTAIGLIPDSQVISDTRVEIPEQAISEYRVEEEDEPLPMEHGNSLVVYDLLNPENNFISDRHEDYSDAIPLDNGNTIVSGLMQIMPRR